MVDFLIKHGANRQHRCCLDRTACMAAANEEHLPVIRYFFEEQLITDEEKTYLRQLQQSIVRRYYFKEALGELLKDYVIMI